MNAVRWITLLFTQLGIWIEDFCSAAKTADVEVAHRAFLVPPHKKRGKGGRQPASDPRLDPNIDERRAKRILANRLSAARSKMKQKNQMDVSSKPSFPSLPVMPQEQEWMEVVGSILTSAPPLASYYHLCTKG